MKYDIIKYSSHAIKRMFERKIRISDVADILDQGEIIKEYPDDKPYPSFLIGGTVNGRLLHVVAAYDEVDNACYIITAYEPYVFLRNKDFNERKTI
jgi:hypothetical protein